MKKHLSNSSGINHKSLRIVFGIVLLLAMALTGNRVFAQVPSAINIQAGTTNFYEIQKHFYDYYQGRPITKGTGYKVFRRWEWYWEQRVGRSGVFPPNNVVVSEWEKYAAANVTHNPSDTAATWTSMGPASSTSGYAGMGRVNCIAFDPKDKNTFWVGTPSGGLWKTNDYGQNWMNFDNKLSDPVLGVSDIVIDPANPLTMYIATGDGDGGSLSAYNGTTSGDNKSIGILKSVDGGLSWATTGLNWKVTYNLLIRRLIMNPAKSSVLLAATSKGIYKSVNAGATFDSVQGGYFMDIIYKPGDTTILYASTKGIRDNLGGFSPSAQIYKSVNGGRNWVQKTFLTGVGRIKLAVSPQRYALVEALCTNVNQGFHSLLRSSDEGETYKAAISLDPSFSNNYLNAYAPGKIKKDDGQGEYDLFYLINPADSSERWIGGVNTWKSLTANSFELKTYWSENETAYQITHADKHWFAFHPLEPGTLFDCNDGGVYYTKNKGGKWTDISNGLQIGQIYKIANSYSDNKIVIGGFQDNGTQVYNNGAWISPSAVGGDGMTCQIDYVDPNVKYASYCDGVIYRTNDPAWGYANVKKISDTIPGKPGGAWVTPFVLDPKDTSILYAGCKMKLFKGTNRGDKWTSLLTLPSPVPSYDSSFRHLAISRNNPKLMYAATGYKLFKTTTDWSSSKLITLPDTNMMITGISINEDKPDTVFITFSGYTDSVKVFRIYNNGKKWDNLSKTLPNLPVNCIEFHEQANDAIYIGTDVGVYYRNAAMNNWKYFNKGLPNVVVTDLKIQYKAGKIRAATFGRGLWESNLYTPPGKYQLNAVEIPIIGGKLKGDGLYNPGQKARMVAIPDTGWAFAGWYDQDVKISDSLDFDFVVNEDEDLVGLFTQSTGIADTKVKDKIRIFPNPTNGILKICMDKGTQDDLQKVVATNMEGKPVFESPASGLKEEFSINLSANSQGNYLITFYLKSGGKISYLVIINR
jgi:photosystem II stability/assembly factor-like uncharacterized protein